MGEQEMKLGILFSGGKDSMYACYLAKKEGYEVCCLITIISKNKESLMFHTPSIEKMREQARVMDLPSVIVKTKGQKEEELKDLEKAIRKAVEKFGIEGVVTGAIESVYQTTRIQKICNKLKIECFNPLWQKNQNELLEDLIKDKFEVIITGVFSAGFDEKWLGRKIDKKFVQEILKLNKKYKINIAGEGGEFETFVLNCPLFKRKLKIDGFKDYRNGNSWTREIEAK